MEKAVIYVRVSTLDQNTDRQISNLKAYSKQLNYEVVQEFTDTMSGFKKKLDDRTGFNSMIEYINKNKICHILVSELSRISRQYIQTVNFIHECSTKSINIHLQKEGLSTLNPDGSINIVVQMMVGLLSSIANQESETLSYRIISGKINEFRKGNSYNGRLFGYDKINGKPVINEEEAKIVREMFDLLLDGVGCRKIASYLNENYSSRVWSSASVYGVVTNTFLMGKRRFRDMTIPVDAIVSEEVFNQAQAFIKSRFRFVGDTKYVNPFASFIRCNCGATFTQNVIASSRVDVYKCSASCGTPSINRPYLISEVKNLLEINAKLSRDKEERAKFNSKIKVNKAIILKNSKRLEVVEKMCVKNYDLFTSEKISESQFDNALLRYEKEKLILNEDNLKLKESNKSITNTLKNEILHYSDDLEIFKSQLLPILKNIIIDKKFCTINFKGDWFMYFEIYRGEELKLYNKHLKKHGKTVEFKPTLKVKNLDTDTQLLLDNYLDSNPY